MMGTSQSHCSAILLIVSIILFIRQCQSTSSCTNALSCANECSYSKDPSTNVTFICLRGRGHYENGLNYGQALKAELLENMQRINASYSSVVGYQRVLRKAQQFADRYGSVNFRFIRGMAVGARLSLNDATILNAQAMLPRTDDDDEITFGCTFAYVPGNKMNSGASHMLRNYDLPGIYGSLAQNTHIVVVADRSNDGFHVPTATIGLVGEIYCPSCFNSRGLFAEFNNGMASGGSEVVLDRRSMLIEVYDAMRRAGRYADLYNSLNALASDYSLIVNVADGENGVASFEYSSTNGSQVLKSDNQSSFVSTNYYQSGDWGERAVTPTDLQCSFGYTRHDNMMALIATLRNAYIEDIYDIMDVPMAFGGAKSLLTSYQVIYAPRHQEVAVRSTKVGKWRVVDMGRVFEEAEREVDDGARSRANTTMSNVFASLFEIVMVLSVAWQVHGQE